MDKIQRVLVKAGRKDLAQKYYETVAVQTSDFSIGDVVKEVKKGDKANTFQQKGNMIIKKAYRNSWHVAKRNLEYHKGELQLVRKENLYDEKYNLERVLSKHTSIDTLQQLSKAKTQIMEACKSFVKNVKLGVKP